MLGGKSVTAKTEFRTPDLRLIASQERDKLRSASLRESARPRDGERDGIANAEVGFDRSKVNRGESSLKTD